MNLMPLIDELDRKNVGIKGDSLFINMLPIDSPIGVLLRNSLTGTAIDYELRGYFRTEFHMIVRAGSYPAGESLVQKATEALTFNNLQLGEYFFNYSRPKTEAVAYPLSNGNLLEFSVYFSVSFYKVNEDAKEKLS